jgi:hypothetical protein
MASWELPDPQGPLFPEPCRPMHPPCPATGFIYSYRFTLPCRAIDDILGQFLQQQRYLASNAGIERTAAGLPHYKAYSVIFDVLHLECVIMSRYGQPKPPRGFVGLLKRSDCGDGRPDNRSGRQVAQGHLGLPTRTTSARTSPRGQGLSVAEIRRVRHRFQLFPAGSTFPGATPGTRSRFA